MDGAPHFINLSSSFFRPHAAASIPLAGCVDVFVVYCVGGGVHTGSAVSGHKARPGHARRAHEAGEGAVLHVRAE